MEKSNFAVVFIGIIVVLCIFLVMLLREKQKSIADIGRTFILGILMNVAYLVSLFVSHAFVLELLYTFELIVEGWVLFLFLRFANARNSFWKQYKETYRTVGIGCLAIDNFLLLFNLFVEKFFAFKQIPIGDSIYVCAEWSWYFVIHWIATILLEVLVVVVMIRKTISVARVYRGRYILGTIIFALIVLINIFGRLLTDNMNVISVAIVSLGAIFYYYMYFEFPMFRALRMKTYAINNMSEPVLMFDYNNNLQVYNKAAEELLQVQPYYTIQEYILDNDLEYSLKNHGTCCDKKHEFTRAKFMGAKTYLIHGQELWDEKNRFVGTLILYSDITGQEKLKNEATQYATRDQLTGLWNRDYFFEVVSKNIRENPKQEFLLIATDIYQFKMFNQILGLETGDDLLLAMAQAYRQRYKRNWVFSRIAGDRFALLIPKADYKEEVFLDIVHEVLSRKNYSMKIHCYVGVYEITDRSISAESMYDRAYMALESIKGSLDKEIAYYNEELLNQRIRETTTLDELDRALLNNEFVIFLQPQIHVESGAIVSAEALIRWDKPDYGIVLPGEFIPIFENNDMIGKLDYYVWELACKQLFVWKEMGHTQRSISVNISAKDFYLTDLYESITGLIEKYEINPANLKLEITETAFVLDVKKQMELVRKLQDYGFTIEIDDFGSGYSSLNSLKDIAVDVLKMDLKFFEKTDETNRAEKIIASVINLANDLGMPVIAEGVESVNHVEMLKAAGCQMVQGYRFAKPMSVDEYEEFVANRTFKDMKEIIETVKSRSL